MAKAYPDSTFVGIDIANVFPKENVPPNVEFKIMSALDLSRFNENSFEFVHTRLLIAGFTEENWLSMIKSMYRIVSPGGLVQFMEYNIMVNRNISYKLVLIFITIPCPHRLHPHTLAFARPILPLSKMAVQNWVDALYGFRPFLLPFLCPENPDRFQSIIDTYINDCIKSNWYKEAMVVVGIKPIGA
ncbi:hypothetical protein CLU79DRAFT_857796 [Phycomyces nitens]|nr:hypothetical protein CLU79DRAFT_857796 [Phycomyces nitens]